MKQLQIASASCFKRSEGGYKRLELQNNLKRQRLNRKKSASYLIMIIPWLVWLTRFDMTGRRFIGNGGVGYEDFTVTMDDMVHHTRQMVGHKIDVCRHALSAYHVSVEEAVRAGRLIRKVAPGVLEGGVERIDAVKLLSMDSSDGT